MTVVLGNAAQSDAVCCSLTQSDAVWRRVLQSAGGGCDADCCREKVPGIQRSYREFRGTIAPTCSDLSPALARPR